ncbi:MAG: CoA-transferase subunit beta [Candidatus Thorarchaeota archaeon]
MIPKSQEYCYDELVLTTLAHQLHDGDRVFTGVASPVQMMAILLAKATHAPRLLYFTILGSVNPTPDKLPYSTGDPHLFDNCENAISFPEIFDLANKGRMDVAFLGGVQIDQFGNLNMSIIGENYGKPRVRLPGGAGGPIMIRSFRRTIAWRPNHSRKCLVEKVPFITSPGWIPSAEGTRNGGPDVMVTDLCVFQFDRDTKRIQLKSIFPEIHIDTIKERTGFQFTISKEIPTWTLPTSEEQEIINTIIDPKGIRKALLKPPK